MKLSMDSEPDGKRDYELGQHNLHPRGAVAHELGHRAHAKAVLGHLPHHQPARTAKPHLLARDLQPALLHVGKHPFRIGKTEELKLPEIVKAQPKLELA